MEKSVAIVGASNDRSKFGNKAVRAYLKAGWTVYPVNPKEETIEGLPAFQTLMHCPQPITRISMYVPPSVGKKMLIDLLATAHDELFFNPGADGEDIIEEVEAMHLHPTKACSIVDIGMSPGMFPDE